MDRIGVLIISRSTHRLLEKFWSSNYRITNDIASLDSSEFELDMDDQTAYDLSLGNHLQIGNFVLVQIESDIDYSFGNVFYFGIIREFKNKTIETDHFYSLFDVEVPRQVSLSTKVSLKERLAYEWLPLCTQMVNHRITAANYKQVSKTTGKSPKEEGWYELKSGSTTDYILSQDTIAISGKKYFSHTIVTAFNYNKIYNGKHENGKNNTISNAPSLYTAYFQMKSGADHYEKENLYTMHQIKNADSANGYDFGTVNMLEELTDAFKNFHFVVFPTVMPRSVAKKSYPEFIRTDGTDVSTAFTDDEFNVFDIGFTCGMVASNDMISEPINNNMYEKHVCYPWQTLPSDAIVVNEIHGFYIVPNLLYKYLYNGQWRANENYWAPRYDGRYKYFSASPINETGFNIEYKDVDVSESTDHIPFSSFRWIKRNDNVYFKSRWSNRDYGQYELIPDYMPIEDKYGINIDSVLSKEFDIQDIYRKQTKIIRSQANSNRAYVNFQGMYKNDLSYGGLLRIMPPDLTGAVPWDSWENLAEYNPDVSWADTWFGYYNNEGVDDTYYEGTFEEDIYDLEKTPIYEYYRTSESTIANRTIGKPDGTNYPDYWKQVAGGSFITNLGNAGYFNVAERTPTSLVGKTTAQQYLGSPNSNVMVPYMIGHNTLLSTMFEIFPVSSFNACNITINDFYDRYKLEEGGLVDNIYGSCIVVYDTQHAAPQFASIYTGNEDRAVTYLNIDYTDAVDPFNRIVYEFAATAANGYGSLISPAKYSGNKWVANSAAPFSVFENGIALKKLNIKQKTIIINPFPYTSINSDDHSIENMGDLMSNSFYTNFKVFNYGEVPLWGTIVNFNLNMIPNIIIIKDFTIIKTKEKVVSGATYAPSKFIKTNFVCIYDESINTTDNQYIRYGISENDGAGISGKLKRYDLGESNVFDIDLENMVIKYNLTYNYDSNGATNPINGLRYVPSEFDTCKRVIQVWALNTSDDVNLSYQNIPMDYVDMSTYSYYQDILGKKISITDTSLVGSLDIREEQSWIKSIDISINEDPFNAMYFYKANYNIQTTTLSRVYLTKDNKLIQQDTTTPTKAKLSIPANVKQPIKVRHVIADDYDKDTSAADQRAIELAYAANELTGAADFETEISVDIYYDNPYIEASNLRPGMLGTIRYQEKTYEKYLLTSIEVDTSKNYFTLKFGTFRTSIYSLKGVKRTKNL